MSRNIVRPKDYLKKYPPFKRHITFIHNLTKNLTDNELIEWLKEKREEADRGFKIKTSFDTDNIETYNERIYQIGKRAIVDLLIKDNKLCITKKSGHYLYKKYESEFKNKLESYILMYPITDKEDDELIEDTKQNAKTGIPFSLFKLIGGVQRKMVPVQGQMFEKTYFTLMPFIESSPLEVKLSTFIYPSLLPNNMESPTTIKSTFNGNQIANYDVLYDILEKIENSTILITKSRVGIGKFGLNECINIVEVSTENNIADIIKKEFINEKIEILNDMLYKPKLIFSFHSVDDLIVNEVQKHFLPKIKEMLKVTLNSKIMGYITEISFGDNLSVVRLLGKGYGIVNLYGDVILDYIYDNISKRKDGFYHIEKGFKQGLLNEKGQVVCELKYREIGEFVNGYAPVEVNGKWGFINRSGREICEIKYESVCDFDKGITLVSEYENKKFYYKFLNIDGTEIEKISISSYYCFIVGKVHNGIYEVGNYTNRNSGGVIPFISVFISIEGYIFENVYLSNKLRPRVKLSWINEKNSKLYHDSCFGYLNRNGKVIIPINYVSALDFVNSKALVMKFIGKKEKASCFFIDKYGKKLKNVKTYDSINSFDNGFYPVRLGGLWGYINEEGKEICHPKYEETSKFNNGVAIVRKDYKYGLINSKLQEISDFIYYKINNFNNDIAIAIVKTSTYSDTYTILSSDGNELTSQRYITIAEFKYGMAKVKSIENKWGFINKDYKEVIPCIYWYVYSFGKDGYAKVCMSYEDQDWILIDKTGIKISDTEDYYSDDEDPYTYKDSVRDAYGDIIGDDF